VMCDRVAVGMHTAYIDTASAVALLICYWNQHNADAKKVTLCLAYLWYVYIYICV